jgi:hypothetical protein
MKKCIHYISCDTIKYCKEAEASAISFRNSSTNVHIKLYTDCAFKSSVFDEIVKVENYIPNGKTSKDWTEGKLYFQEKIRLLSESSFEKNLYLDGDTKSLVNIDPIFDMLNKFSFVLAHDSCRTNKWSDQLGIPICYPEFNLGLFFYDRDTTKEFFNEWAKNFELHPQPHDQASFRLTMWNCNLRYATLPPEYNHRPKVFHHNQQTAILHGRGDGFLPEIKQYENNIFLI